MLLRFVTGVVVLLAIQAAAFPGQWALLMTKFSFRVAMSALSLVPDYHPATSTRAPPLGGTAGPIPQPRVHFVAGAGVVAPRAGRQGVPVLDLDARDRALRVLAGLRRPAKLSREARTVARLERTLGPRFWPPRLAVAGDATVSPGRAAGGDQSPAGPHAAPWLTHSFGGAWPAGGDVVLVGSSEPGTAPEDHSRLAGALARRLRMDVHLVIEPHDVNTGGM
jgi:hypothetical protein